MEPELSSGPEKAHHRRAMTRSRWVIRGVAKIHLFKRAQHSPRGLLPPLRTPHKSTTPHVCLEKIKKDDPQPPGLMWHMRVQGRDVELER